MKRNTWIEIDLGTLTANIMSLRRNLSKGTEIVFLVKADAYGHGMETVAKKAWSCGVRWFAVAHIHDALELRDILPKAKIMVVGVLNPTDVPLAVKNGIIPFVTSRKHGMALAEAARKHRLTLRCHAKVDTGMGRLGIAWENAVETISELCGLAGLEITGICSHFASADDADRTFADIQFRRFAIVARGTTELTGRRFFTHMSNSAAILGTRKWDFDAVRPGILLYGYARPTRAIQQSRKSGILCKPFLQWKTTVIQVKAVPSGFPVSYNSTYITKRGAIIATVNAGYSDGLPRLLSNRGCMLAGGRRCRIAGRVTMNFTAIDLGPRTNVKEGDEVVIIGKQGNESIWADELAELSGTIPYEILTNIKTCDRRTV